MPFSLLRTDVDFLLEVRRLGMEGRTQTEVADELGLSLTTVRNRLARLGFEVFPCNDVRAILGAKRLMEMLDAEEIVTCSEELAVAS